MRRVSVLVALVAAAFVAAWLVFGAGRSVAAQDATPVAAAFPLTPTRLSARWRAARWRSSSRSSLRPPPVAVTPGAATVDACRSASWPTRRRSRLSPPPCVRSSPASTPRTSGGPSRSSRTRRCVGSPRRSRSRRRNCAASGATPEALPTEGWTTILAITDVVVLADGRVGALVASLDPTQPEEDRPRSTSPLCRSMAAGWSTGSSSSTPIRRRRARPRQRR